MKQKAFTLVELIIVIAIVAIIAAVIMGAVGGCTADWQQAEKYAKEYAAKVPGSTGEVSCMKKDSDGDGYCRCTIFKSKGDPINVECGCERYCVVCAEGCGGIKAHVPSRSE